LKAELEETARAEGVSMAQLLESMATQALAERAERVGEDAAAKRERIIAQRAAECFGTIRGGRADRSVRVREDLRNLLREKHARPSHR